MSTAPLFITDHALLRWLERAKGIDIEFMRDFLWQEVRDVALSGASQHRTPDCTFVFKDNKLVTVLPAGGQSRKSRRHVKETRVSL